MANKFEGVVKFTNQYSFWSNSYSYRGTEIYIYKFEDSDGNIYVWKTGSILQLDCKEMGVDGKDSSDYFPEVGATIKIAASIKGENEYRGEHQIVLNRVKVVKIIDQPLSKEEKEKIKRESQLETLKDGDFVWEMPYRQYKNHYADCETLAGSFVSGEYGGPALISVIIREGRLKNSGVRFQKFDTYRFVTPDRKHVRCMYAVSEENARKRVEKESPNYEWVFDGVTERIW